MSRETVEGLQEQLSRLCEAYCCDWVETNVHGDWRVILTRRTEFRGVTQEEALLDANAALLPGSLPLTGTLPRSGD